MLKLAIFYIPGWNPPYGLQDAYNVCQKEYANMVPEVKDSSTVISDADAQMSQEERATWTAKRDGFLLQKIGDSIHFAQLYRRIAAVARTNETTWPDLYESNRFQDAFNYVTARILTPAGFRNVQQKYAAYLATNPPSALSMFSYVINRVNLILKEWRSRGVDSPVGKVTPDEHIESTAIVQSTREQFPLHALSLRIDSLSLQHRATLILRLWPLQCFPESWRATYRPVIQQAAQKNGLTATEVEQRLNDVLQNRQPVSEDGLLKAETRRGLHFAKERHFDLQKRARFAHLRRLEDSGQYTPEPGVESLGKRDCYAAVKKSSEAGALAIIAAEDVLSRSATGIRRVCDPNWFRRSFCRCCYKQKYHRRIWLNARLELLTMKPENGPMSHAEIGYVLNCPENTSFSNLNRAIRGLQEAGSGDALCEQIDAPASSDLKIQKQNLQQESFDPQLEAFVCEDLQPAAG